MDSNKYLGIVLIILGLIFMCFPLFTSVLFSVIIGVALFFLGISALLVGWDIRHESGTLAAFAILLAIIGIVLGILFIFYVDAVAILTGISFYILGIFMIVVGIYDMIAKKGGKAKCIGLIVAILGIIAFFIGVYAIVNPIYAAVLVGVVLILEGIFLFIEGE